ncbi:MAG: hypothetical protein P4L41_10295 [Flavipsychrobacter sp.]|nr:hypothetical protein [Flavipsychrobacter sp.]
MKTIKQAVLLLVLATSFASCVVAVRPAHPWVRAHWEMDRFGHRYWVRGHYA